MIPLFSSTLSPLTAVVQVPGPIQNPTPAWKVEQVSNVTENKSSSELLKFDTAVLSAPMPPTTPMSMVTASSSPIVQPRLSKFEEPRYVLVLVPVILLFGLALVLGIIFICVQRRKKLDALRHRLIPVYNFAPGEEDDWGVETQALTSNPG